MALAAAATGAAVQLVGKVGDDAAGDAVLIALAAGGVGHAAVLRDPAHETPVIAAPTPDADEALFADDGVAASLPPADGLPLEAADVQLALRYLTDFRVLVVAAPLDEPTLAAALDAAAFASAHVVRLDGAGAAASGDGGDDVPTTSFEAPEHDEPAFATLVAGYAVALDAGRDPADAFSEATRGSAWEPAASD